MMDILDYRDISAIDRALHDYSVKSVELLEDTHKIHVSDKNGCRYTWYKHIMFMEQNKNKPTEWATLAMAGNSVTWGRHEKEGYKYLIFNGQIYELPKDDVAVDKLKLGAKQYF